MGSSDPDIAAVHHFWSDLNHVAYDRKKQVVSGAVKGIDHFASTFSDESYVLVPLKVWGENWFQVDIQSKEPCWERNR